jgi:hypothetical protein
MADNSRAINRVFNRRVISELLQIGSNKVFDIVVSRYINAPEHKTHAEIIRKIYAYLSKEQRNEYYYINTLLNILLVGIHNVNTTTALSQVRIGNRIADFVMINDVGCVYEIKSDLDNFGRLRDQLRDYYKAFSKVTVLASEHERNRVEKLLDTFSYIGNYVGIYVLSERDTIFSRTSGRDPKQFDKYLDYSCIFKLLRKREYENIILQYFGEIKKVAPVFHFRMCLEKFTQIPIKMAQSMAFIELKKRNKISKTVFESIIPELKSTIYFSGLSRKLPELEQFLKATYRE